MAIHELIEFFLVVELGVLVNIVGYKYAAILYRMDVVVAQQMHELNVIDLFYIAQVFFESLGQFVSRQMSFGYV